MPAPPPGRRSLTAFQVRQIKAATIGTGKIAIRVGSSTTGGVKCGVFAILYAPIGIVLPSGWAGRPFQTALKTAPYGARILVSSDSATELAAVRTLIRQGIKVLILTPQDSAAAAAAADEARVRRRQGDRERPPDPRHRGGRLPA